MRVFVTGATGFIGTAIVQELITAGHQVLGLARSDASAATLAAAGVEVHRGTLEDTDSLQRGAAAADGIIHTAFIHDFSQYAANAATDLRAIEAMISVLEGSGKPLVITSGTVVVPPGQVSTENANAAPDSPASVRAPSEVAVLAAAERGIRGSIVRLPPSVHGDGDHGFVPALINIAREKGISAYIGNGLNRWPAVHRLDAALLFRLALEKGAAGSKFHGVGDQGVPVRDIAAVIGRRLGVPVAGKLPEEAAAHFGWLAGFLGGDYPASSAKTQAQLGWAPQYPGLIEDLDREAYFNS